MGSLSKTLGNEIKKTNLLILGGILLSSNLGCTKGPDLSGLWYETMNYPASSIMNFKKVGDDWHGTYVQVSGPQKLWGFNVGETVIKGKLNGKKFIGKVLLKYPEHVKKNCNKGEDKWEKIQMNVVDPNKLYGLWQQTRVIYRTDTDYCKEKILGWQPYGLERVKI